MPHFITPHFKLLDFIMNDFKTKYELQCHFKNVLRKVAKNKTPAKKQKKVAKNLTVIKELKDE